MWDPRQVGQVMGDKRMIVEAVFVNGSLCLLMHQRYLELGQMFLGWNVGDIFSKLIDVMETGGAVDRQE